MNAEDIRARLSTLGDEPKFDFKVADLGDLLDSAVLIAFTEGENGVEVVLTRRAEHLRKHAGQISFPGGRRDADDPDLLHTALRETHEELAIHPDDVRVYGALLRIPTITGFNITAYVGEFPQPYTLVPNPAEIADLIVAPLHMLMDPAIHRVKEQEWAGQMFKMHSFQYGEHNIWGATGFMLYEFFRYLGIRS